MNKDFKLKSASIYGDLISKLLITDQGNISQSNYFKEVAK